MLQRPPGLTGLTSDLLKNYGTLSNSIFFNCFKHFETSGSLARGCNPSFLVLSPKKNDPIYFSDYRPISLIGRVYKIISKMFISPCKGDSQNHWP